MEELKIRDKVEINHQEELKDNLKVGTVKRSGN